MIAWLSLCVLAAGWGSSLDESWRTLWREIGAFGLVSAVGLSTARELHLAYRRRTARRTTEGMLTRRMATELFEGGSPDSLRPTIERFFADFEDNSSSLSDRRLGTPEHPPAMLYPLDRDDPRSTKLKLPGVTADVRNISLSGIGLSHNERVPVGPMLLVYETRSGERLIVGVQLSWCRPAGVGEYVSGGHFVDFSRSHPALDEQSRELQTA